MVKKELVKIIKKRREDGLTDEQIKATLINAGHLEQDINESVEASYKEPAYVVEEEEKPEAPKKKSWWPF